MTDEANALMERLRWGAWYYEDPFDGKAYASDDPLEAADRIEHLEQALREIIDFGDGDTGYGNSCAKIARAALAGDSHD